MPQLDAATFLSQIFWLTLFFSTFYLIVLKNILPTVSRIIKVRSKKVTYSRQNISSLENEKNQILQNYESIITQSLQQSNDLINRTSANANEWVNKTAKETNSQKDASNFNGIYIKTIGDITGKKRLIKNCVALYINKFKVSLYKL